MNDIPTYHTGYGPVITCGAAAITLGEDQTYTTSFDIVAVAVKRLVRGEYRLGRIIPGHRGLIDQPELSLQKPAI